MKTKNLTDKQIQEQINELEEENRNTQRLSMGRGHGWGDDAIEKRRNKILHLNSILFARRVEKTKPTPKKQGLTRTWDSKTKRWVYHYTKRTKKAKGMKQPDTKLSQHDKLLLAGEYKIQGKPKEVRKLGKAVTKGLNSEGYDIVGYLGNQVGTLKKTTRKYYMDTTGTKYLRGYSGDVCGGYEIVKKKTKPKIPTGMTLQKSLTKTGGQCE